MHFAWYIDVIILLCNSQWTLHSAWRFFSPITQGVKGCGAFLVRLRTRCVCVLIKRWKVILYAFRLRASVNDKLLWNFILFPLIKSRPNVNAPAGITPFKLQILRSTALRSGWHASVPENGTPFGRMLSIAKHPMYSGSALFKGFPLYGTTLRFAFSTAFRSGWTHYIVWYILLIKHNA